MGKKILSVATSSDQLGDIKTGLWLEELAAPYYIWKKKGYSVTVASIKGGQIPLDPMSLKDDYLTEPSKTFLDSEAAMKELKNSPSVKSVNMDEYDALYIPGGHGIMIDGPKDPHLRKTVETAAKQGKVISAVCHGPAGLVSAEVDGKPVVKGRKVTAFSNSEEKNVGKESEVPFLLEDKLKELGAKYEKGKDWSPHVVTDGKLVTGQNPQSSAPLAEAVAKVLE
ncbi:class I glutamine amidotransferase-like protein [Coccomyxa subellipsoidea C-169]|uniref:Class I glutamine amidotransferase-like protein n=1 Tax=Coccomyxa subellipsoidea (strain C-169) TaxID=574566 RepID=I0YU15_COCSC|nr:class I glutamine amidotransferase-like protein [Coccomyxa subellipsoidea C-169]EIE21884.1 class I glutamine amidotransferase-like protein [Coccomyxa subellipsoidea C-169]|eukprot:XP_005646428.1 class I glutamine amidotransferase-like protein [Coccomyxa subellipsoidea C-169]